MRTGARRRAAGEAVESASRGAGWTGEGEAEPAQGEARQAEEEDDGGDELASGRRERTGGEVTLELDRPTDEWTGRFAADDGQGWSPRQCVPRLGRRGDEEGKVATRARPLLGLQRTLARLGQSGTLRRMASAGHRRRAASASRARGRALAVGRRRLRPAISPAPVRCSFSLAPPLPEGLDSTCAALIEPVRRAALLFCAPGSPDALSPAALPSRLDRPSLFSSASPVEAGWRGCGSAD